MHSKEEAQMMKHIVRFALLLCLCLCLCLTASAEPRYPSRSGATTDTAAVFSHTTMEDLNEFHTRLERSDTLMLHIVTVDFLDAQEVSAYADTLFDRWKLGKDDLLLLLAVGEDQYAVKAGKNVEKRISVATQAKLLATNLYAPFDAQDYDSAIASWLVALTREVNKSYGASIKADDLFGRSTGSFYQGWAEGLQKAVQSVTEDSGFFLTEEDKSTGFSFLKVVLTIVLLVIIFGSRKKKGFPFGKLLAGFALYKLWKKR